ncbi:hypothetical protein [Rhodanobacter sp. OK091]|uniref:hypothetical protein n=1 Tax=Rhodanobacter sp. OK091 TaxID=1881037 RepID=UPI000917A952|nr:hypothetical protein [Rhodanobacter sp. OK091]SHM49171.1 hypothetical protein SAMN05428972_3778 [Rhodanobacter sp. OK091]
MTKTTTPVRLIRSWLNPVTDKTMVVIVVVSSVLACVGAFFLEAHLDFNLWDEGFLWYGVQHTLLGEIPIRDFMSYDPGRYYWAAGLMWLLQINGIVAVRATTAAFSMLGVITGTLLVLRGSSDGRTARIGLCAFATVMFLLWLVPRWKGYDAAISIILIASLTRLLTRPTVTLFFQHGVVVGVAAILGRNHGLYGIVACLLVIPILLFADPKPQWHRFIPAWIGGVTAGYSPMLIGFLMDHRFTAMFWDGIRFTLFEYKGTNLPLPVPWPWAIHSAGESVSMTAREWFIGSFFVALPALCIGGALFVFRQMRHERRIQNPAFVACVATAIPYLNVAFSRADVAHLAQAIFPCIIGLIICPIQGSTRTVHRRVVLPLLAIASLSVTLPLHSGFVVHTQNPDDWQAIDVRGDSLLVDRFTAAAIGNIKCLAKRYVPPGGSVFAAPVWPGVYTLLGTKSPVWEIYPLMPRNEAFQQQEINRLRRADPALLFIYDIAVDGRNELRYANTHPLVWQFVNTNYRMVPTSRDRTELLVYVPKTTPGQSATFGAGAVSECD